MVIAAFVPLALSLLLALPIGVALAWAAKAELARHDGHVTATRAFAVTAAFSGLVYAPQVAYFCAFHGDWSYAYAIAWSRIPSAVDLLLVVASAALIVGAFTVAAPFAAQRRTAIVAALLVAPLSTAAGLSIVLARRLATSATYAQFHGGFGAHGISDTALGRAVLVANVVVAGGLAWSIRLVRLGRPPRPARR